MILKGLNEGKNTLSHSLIKMYEANRCVNGLEGEI